MTTRRQPADQTYVDHSNCWHRDGIVRMTDPCMKETLARVEREITKDRESALSFLQMIGVCTSEGKLAERYGGDPSDGLPSTD